MQSTSQFGCVDEHDNQTWPKFSTFSKSPRRRLQIFVSPIFWGGKRMETVLAILCTKEHLTALIQTVWTWTLRNQNSCQQGNPRPAKSQTEASTAIVLSTPSTYCQNLPKQSFVEQFVCLVSPGWQKHWRNVSAMKSGKQSKQKNIYSDTLKLRMRFWKRRAAKKKRKMPKSGVLHFFVPRFSVEAS